VDNQSRARRLIMQVREIMTPSAELVDANTMIRDAAVKMRDGVWERFRWATMAA
jgi:hypothetical protein